MPFVEDIYVALYYNTSGSISAIFASKKDVANRRANYTYYYRYSERISYVNLGNSYWYHNNSLRGWYAQMWKQITNPGFTVYCLS